MDLPLNRQIGYASGNFGKSLLWTSLDYLALFYMTEVVGIPIHWAGSIILVTLLWDAAINPFIGFWIDQRSARGADYRPFLRWAPVGTAIAFVALLWVPGGTMAAKAAYVVTMLFVLRSGYALLDVPHNALLAHLPVNAAARMRLAGMRYFFSSIGGVAIALWVAPALSGSAGESASHALMGMAAVAGAILCISLWQSLGPARLATAARSADARQLRPMAFMSALLHNRVVIVYLLLAAVFAATLPLYAKMLPYMLSYVVAKPSDLAALFGALTIGQLVSIPIWTVALRHFDHIRLGQLALTGLAATFALLWAVGMGSGPMLTGFTFVIGAFMGGAVQILWGLSGRVSDSIDAISGMRLDGGLLSLLTFVQKAALGLGAMAVGLVLEGSGFVSGQAVSTATQQVLALVALVIPALGAALSAGLLAMLFVHLAHGEPRRAA